MWNYSVTQNKIVFFEKAAVFDFKIDGFPSFDLLLDSFFVESGLLKYFLITGFHSTFFWKSIKLSLKKRIFITAPNYTEEDEDLEKPKKPKIQASKQRSSLLAKLPKANHGADTMSSKVQVKKEIKVFFLHKNGLKVVTAWIWFVHHYLDSIFAVKCWNNEIVFSILALY